MWMEGTTVTHTSFRFALCLEKHPVPIVEANNTQQNAPKSSVDIHEYRWKVVKIGDNIERRNRK